MRIVHTSDWHAGRVWKQRSRLDELGAVLDHLAEHIERTGVDLLLVTGDVFDSGAPSAAAEKLVFSFLKRVGGRGVQTVLIAGNHDSAARIDAWGQLAELVGVHARGRPRRPEEGGVIELTTKDGEVAVVATLPFASPRHLVSALDMAEGDTEAASRYADRMRRAIDRLCRAFRADAVNLLCAHTHLDGAVLSNSERTVHVGDDWAATPQGLPSNAHYVALGHIHRPQTVDAPSPTRYAGSPLQLDFGEEGEQKSFVVVEASAGTPARVERVPYEGGRPLRTVQASLSEIEARVGELREAGWLRVRVDVERPDPEVNQRVRGWLPNAVSVDVVLPEADEDEPAPLVTLADHRPREVFAAYYEGAHGRHPDGALLDLFDELYAERGGA